MTIHSVHDASAMAALRRLNQTAGAHVDAKELMHAIQTGTADHDGQAAGREWKDFHHWAQTHQAKLTPAAKKLMGVYDHFAASARAHGQAGLTDAQSSRMLDQMAKVAGAEKAKPPATSGAVGAARPGETTKHQLGRLNRYFKRQARDATWNPTGPLASGNCAVCSLAMAAQAFGKEPPRFAAEGRKGVQPSIDWMAHQMGKSHLPGQPHNFGATTVPQVEKGAHHVGLHTKHIRPTSHDLSPLDGALKKGQMVVLTGAAGPAYRHAVGHSFAGAHSILVMGKTNDGHYVVADPLSRHGTRALTAAQLKNFMAHAVTGGTAVWP